MMRTSAAPKAGPCASA